MKETNQLLIEYKPQIHGGLCVSLGASQQERGALAPKGGDRPKN